MNGVAKLAHTLTLMALMLLLCFPLPDAQAQQRECEEGRSLDHAFASGASWSLCLSLDADRGLGLHALGYRAPGDTLRPVLAHLHLAQLLLHRHDSVQAQAQITPGELSDSPLSHGEIVALDSRHCDGTIVSVSTVPAAVCVRVSESRLLAKYASNRAIHGSALIISSTLQLGTLTLTTAYALSEDGAIRPAVIISGRVSEALTRASLSAASPVTAAAEHAQSLPLDSGPLPRFTVLSNWRLVFDLDTPGADRLEEFEFVLDPSSDHQRAMQVRSVAQEGWLDLNREAFRGWRILDDSRAGYYLDPANSGFDYINPSLPWAEHAGAVSRHRTCEQLSMHNQAALDTLVPAANDATGGDENPVDTADTADACGDSLDDFIDGESLAGDPIVLWYSLSRTVSPVIEDWPVLRDRTLSFELLPFDWTAASPFEVQSP